MKFTTAVVGGADARRLFDQVGVIQIGRTEIINSDKSSLANDRRQNEQVAETSERANVAIVHQFVNVVCCRTRRLLRTCYRRIPAIPTQFLSQRSFSFWSYFITFKMWQNELKVRQQFIFFLKDNRGGRLQSHHLTKFRLYIRRTVLVYILRSKFCITYYTIMPLWEQWTMKNG